MEFEESEFSVRNMPGNVELGSVMPPLSIDVQTLQTPIEKHEMSAFQVNSLKSYGFH